MSLETICKCDARGCSNQLEITDYDSAEYEVEKSKWHEDPNEYNVHYCNKCWPKVRVELEIQE